MLIIPLAQLKTQMVQNSNRRHIVRRHRWGLMATNAANLKQAGADKAKKIQMVILFIAAYCLMVAIRPQARPVKSLVSWAKP